VRRSFGVVSSPSRLRTHRSIEQHSGTQLRLPRSPWTPGIRTRDASHPLASTLHARRFPQSVVLPSRTLMLHGYFFTCCSPLLRIVGGVLEMCRRREDGTRR
jgi:hypothetical protein